MTQFCKREISVTIHPAQPTAKILTSYAGRNKVPEHKVVAGLMKKLSELPFVQTVSGSLALKLNLETTCFVIAAQRTCEVELAYIRLIQELYAEGRYE